jgi:PhnB protein
MQIAPYLMFNGNAEEAMNFYAQALGGQVLMIQRYGEAPMPTDEATKNQVMHGGVQIGDTHLMFSDSGGKREATFGDNVHLSLNLSSEEEINAVFERMSAGGNITMPLEDTFWGARFGMLTDKFSVCWMFNWDRPGAKPGQGE